MAYQFIKLPLLKQKFRVLKTDDNKIKTLEIAAFSVLTCESGRPPYKMWIKFVVVCHPYSKD